MIISDFLSKLTIDSNWQIKDNDQQKTFGIRKSFEPE